jgi:hypothetical protein
LRPLLGNAQYLTDLGEANQVGRNIQFGGKRSLGYVCHAKTSHVHAFSSPSGAHPVGKAGEAWDWVPVCVVAQDLLAQLCGAGRSNNW